LLSESSHNIRLKLLRYIAGSLSELDRTMFEQQLLDDQAFSDAVAFCEQELIDAYSRKELNQQEMLLLTPWIECSPRRIQRVAIAHTILPSAPKPVAQTRRVLRAIALAACVVAAVFIPIKRRISSLPSGTIASSSSTSTTPPQVDPTPVSPLKPDVILLAVERIRGDQEPATYSVHRNRPLRLQIMLDRASVHSRYGLQIVSLSKPHDIVVTQNNLQAKSIGQQLYLSVDLPVGSLQPSAYSVSVTRPGSTLVSTFTLRWAL
jgi:hypothetical protein